jgi:mannose-6-phosphate isomerase-like protein (cupin superfamily)
MIVGTLVLNPDLEITTHAHEQPEIFFCVSGRASIYDEDIRIDVQPGHVIYTHKNCPHGASNNNSEPLNQLWVYGTEGDNVSKTSWVPLGDKIAI